MSEESKDLTECTPTAPAMVETAKGAAVSRIQSALTVAKRFPRDENRSLEKIVRACRRKSLAEKATYAYPRGGQVVKGPSIRLAEVMAQAWGNVQFGFREIENRDGESTVEAFCWDMETNVEQTRTFTVKHERKAKGRITRLTDPRDIYEMVANLGQRRVRACILGIIPSDVVEKTLHEVYLTRNGNNESPFEDRLQAVVRVFSADPYGISVDRLEEFLGHPLAETNEEELDTLRAIYTTVKDKQANIRDYFPTSKIGSGGENDDGAEKLDAKLTEDAKDSGLAVTEKPPVAASTTEASP